MSANADWTQGRTSRHFEIGASVYHKEYGYGTIKADGAGRKYPQFEKVTGTPSTRVFPAR